MTDQLGAVKPWVRYAAEQLSTWFNIPNVGGVGSRSRTSDHPGGLALDFMTSDEHGTRLAEYLRENARSMGVTYVIWRQRIWSVARSGEGWRQMEDRGGATENHMDHVHVSFTPTPSPAYNAFNGKYAPGPETGKPPVTEVPEGALTPPPRRGGGKPPETVETSSGGIAEAAGSLIVLGSALTLGCVLIVLGAARLTKPVRDAINDSSSQLAGLALQATPPGRAATLAKGAMQ